MPIIKPRYPDWEGSKAYVQLRRYAQIVDAYQIKANTNKVACQ